MNTEHFLGALKAQQERRESESSSTETVDQATQAAHKTVELVLNGETTPSTMKAKLADYYRTTQENPEWASHKGNHHVIDRRGDEEKQFFFSNV